MSQYYYKNSFDLTDTLMKQFQESSWDFGLHFETHCSKLTCHTFTNLAHLNFFKTEIFLSEISV